MHKPKNDFRPTMTRNNIIIGGMLLLVLIFTGILPAFIELVVGLVVGAIALVVGLGLGAIGLVVGLFVGFIGLVIGLAPILIPAAIIYYLVRDNHSEKRKNDYI